MTSQLRIFTIREGHVGAFLAAWRAGVPPLRDAHGFRVDGAWLAEETNQFFWILSFEGSREDFEREDARYYASPERVAFDHDPAREIAAAEHRFVTAIWPGASERT